MLAKETVAFLGDHYGATEKKDSALTVSAINLEALVPVAQALDTFSVVFLQWLSNDVVWRARERVVKDHTAALTQSLSYDLDELATSIATALYDAADEALVRWAAEAIPVIPYPSLSRTLRVMGSTARKPRHFGRARRCLPPPGRRTVRVPFTARAPARRGRRPDVRDAGARSLGRGCERSRAVHGSRQAGQPCASLRPGRRSSNAPAIASSARRRASLTDAFNGIAAANQLALLATARVGSRARREPGSARNGGGRRAADRRPMRPGAVPSDRSRQAGGVELPGAEIQPRAALDGAADGRRSDQAARPDALASRWSRS